MKTTTFSAIFLIAIVLASSAAGPFPRRGAQAVAALHTYSACVET